MGESRRCVTLTTDFGTSGPYAGSMRGAVLRANPEVVVVDNTHEIGRGNIREGALVIGCSFASFPDGTIHIVVVDPTVGSDRLPILVSTENHYFLAPDNGVLSYIFQHEEIYNVVEITEDHFFNKPTSRTFHGRDIFAPVAGWLAKVQDVGRFGEPISEYVIERFAEPVQVKEKAWKGEILFIDPFGNAITNLTTDHIPGDENGYPAVNRILTLRGEIRQVRTFYCERTEDEPFLILGSLGYYEIAVNGASAAERLQLAPGNEVGVILR
ncbi:MAG: SAM-dependent chlorinase/fluorinase [Acidobacteria bacterium]|nr:SAM-dependent chlorinase/fluorinase [Acidobacteriota bacterium]